MKKKVDITELSDKDETESDSESSDSSVSVSQSDFSRRHFEVDDIKLFLRATKIREEYVLLNIFLT